MILHPDGRIEGTPEEILKYSKLTSPASSRQDDSEERLKKAMEVEGPAKSPIPRGLGGISSQPKGPDTFYIDKR